MEENRSKIFRFRELIIVTLLLFVCGLYSYIINGEFIMIGFIKVISLVTSCVYMSSLLVLIQNNDEYVDDLYRYLSIVFCGVGVLGISYILSINSNIDDIQLFNKLTRMFYVVSIYEIVVIILAFIHFDKKISIKRVSINTVIVTFFAAFLALRCKWTIMKSFDIDRSTSPKIIFEVIVLTLYVILYLLVNKNKDKISIRINNYFKGYIFLRGLMGVLVIISQFIYFSEINWLIFSFKILGDYLIFKIMVLEVIRRPHESLYNNLVYKSKELEENLEELKRKNEEEEIKKQLLANISHEFKTPVNVIYSAIQMQDLKRESNDVNEILKFNSVIKQNCYRLIRLINNFIDSSKLSQQDYHLKLKCINVVSVVENTTMSILSFAESKGINVVFDTEEEEIYVLADRDLIERSILNILSNAIKYNKEDGKIDVLIGVKNNNVIIEVQDSGIGIPKEKQNIIFNRYERADTSLARHKEGTGLGLNIVKEIINKLRGEINIESEENIGTKVTIILPRAEFDEELYKEKNEDSEQIKNDIRQKVELEMSDIYL